LLLQNSIKRVLQTTGILGVYAVVVEAKDVATEGSYRNLGSRLCDMQARQLCLPLGAA
jgi:hypothetical protein